MFVVYLNGYDHDKKFIFCTDLLKTASSFCHTFNTRIEELAKDYMTNFYNKKQPKNWLYESGFNAKVQQLHDSIVLTYDKLSYDDVFRIVTGSDRFYFDRVKQI